MTNRKKILIVFGTRPEAIKMAPLVHMLKSRSDIFSVDVCVTGQHRQMLDQVLSLFQIIPEFDLNIMKPGQDLFDVTANVLLAMKGTLQAVRPDLVLVHGDTTTALASSIASFYHGVPVGHIEAGLRTHNLSMPMPEEFNRQVITKLSRWHFAPTINSKNNLILEGVNNDFIAVTGNTVIDALHWILNRLESDPARKENLYIKLNSILKFDWRSTPFVLITGHRRENFGDGFRQICAALKELAMRFDNIRFVYPVHMNPNVQNPVNSILSGQHNFHLIEPLDYEPFLCLLKHCHLVLTDSGGIQEEAPSLGKPVLVMRDLTERPEAVEAGTVKLVGTNKENIVSQVSRLLEDYELFLKMSQSHNPYGDGNACNRIVKILENLL